MIHLPNILTTTRIFISIIFIYIYLYTYQEIAFILFVICAILDYLDGKIARSYKITSEIGGILDPIADKCIYYSALISIMLMHFNLFPKILQLISITILIFTIIRDFSVDALRIYCSAYQGHSFNASYIAKIKTTLQFGSIIMLIINPYSVAGWLLGFTATVLSIYTGYLYFKYVRYLFD